MAIKVSNTTAITDDRKGSFTTVTTKAVDIATLQGMTGSRVGETVMCTELNGGRGQLVSWTGSGWTLPEQEIEGGVRWQSGNWTYHLFTSPGALTSALPASGEVAVLAGGGGGGSGRIGGGGGAGGFRIRPVSWSIGSNPVVVGSGGAGGNQWPGYGPEPRSPDSWGQPGGPSSFAGITSSGGAGCGRQGGPGGWKRGGSGAGASSWHYPGGAGNYPPVSPSQGNRGGNKVGPYPGGESNFVGAGGGGWGSVGEDCNEPTAQSGRGGLGISVPQFTPLSPSGEAWTIPSGVPIGPYVPLGFAGGGSGYGGTFPSQPQGGNLAPQGIGGGGNGSYSQPKSTKNAKSYGAGGGGGGFRDTTNTFGGDGFAGFVIVRYRTNLLG